MLLAFTSVSHAANVEPYASCKPYTRWWWFTDNIQKKDIREQLIWAKEAGLGGVEIAWLRPRSTAARKANIKGPEWLSPEWTEVVVYAKKCADSLGLGCDYTYGSLWPFMDPDIPEKFGSRKFGEESPAKRGGGWFHPKRGRVLDHLNARLLLGMPNIWTKALNQHTRARNRHSLWIRGRSIQEDCGPRVWVSSSTRSMATASSH